MRASSSQMISQRCRLKCSFTSRKVFCQLEILREMTQKNQLESAQENSWGFNPWKSATINTKKTLPFQRYQIQARRRLRAPLWISNLLPPRRVSKIRKHLKIEKSETQIEILSIPLSNNLWEYLCRLRWGCRKLRGNYKSKSKWNWGMKLSLTCLNQ